MLAAQQGFRKVVGVDLSAELADAARSNISNAQIDASVVQSDVSDFKFRTTI